MSPLLSALSLINVSELETGPSSVISHFISVSACLAGTGHGDVKENGSDFVFEVINDYFLIQKIYFCIFAPSEDAVS